MAYNLFDTILKMVNPETKQAFSQAGQAISKTFSPLAPVTQGVSQAITKTGQELAKPFIQAGSNIVEPVKKQFDYTKKVSDYYKPFRESINQIGLTADDIAQIPEDKKEQILSQLREIGVTLPEIQQPVNQSEDWLSQKSYFGDQRPNEGVIEQAGKGIVRTPLTYAQNAISGPENIAQGSLNLLDKTLGEGVLNPLLNVAGSAIKGDKYKPLPTWYNDVPSTNQYTENVASNIFGAGKEALTTDKTYEQARQELAQQQYKAGKDQGIGGALSNIGGGSVSSAFNILAPGASALFAGASEMPGTQYVTQGLGTLTQAPIDYAVSKAGGTEETANQIGIMANLALPLARNKVAGMKPTSTPGKLLQKTAVTTADAITNPLGTIKYAGTAVFSKNPRSVEDIAGNILQPYKGMTENLEDATAGVRRVVEETGTKTSTYDGLLTAIKNTQNKYGKMLSDSLGQITTSTRSQLFDTALTQLAKIYEGVSSPKFKAIQERINELGKKNVTTGLTPAEKNEVKILHTKSNNLFNEKGQQTGGFSSDDLRALRQDLVAEINKEASDAGITNVADINKAYGELSDARTLAENQVANLKAYKGRTPPPTTMAKITNMIVDFPIIKQVFSDPTRAVASALFKNLRGDKINPIEVQGRLSGFLKELKKAGAKAEEIKKIEQIMLSMKLLPEKSSAKIPYTMTEQDKTIIKQSKPTNITKNGNLDNSVLTTNNNRAKPVKKPIVKPNTIKNESKGVTPKPKTEGVKPSPQVKPKTEAPIAASKKIESTPIVKKKPAILVKNINEGLSKTKEGEAFKIDTQGGTEFINIKGKAEYSDFGVKRTDNSVISGITDVKSNKKTIKPVEKTVKAMKGNFSKAGNGNYELIDGNRQIKVSIGGKDVYPNLDEGVYSVTVHENRINPDGTFYDPGFGNSGISGNREKIIEFLKKEGIDGEQFFPSKNTISKSDFEKATEKMWNNIIEFNGYKIVRVNFRDKPWKIVDSLDFDEVASRGYKAKSFNTKEELYKYIKGVESHKPFSPQKTVKPKNLTEGKQSATMGDMETKKLITPSDKEMELAMNMIKDGQANDKWAESKFGKDIWESYKNSQKKPEIKKTEKPSEQNWAKTAYEESLEQKAKEKAEMYLMDGYEDTLSQMQRGTARRLLKEKMVRTENGIITKQEFLKEKVNQGYKLNTAGTILSKDGGNVGIKINNSYEKGYIEYLKNTRK